MKFLRPAPTMPELLDHLPAKRVELILQQLEQLPTLPAVAIRVLEVTAEESSSAEDVVRLIESDPSLTARILQLVHRADAGVRGEVNTVARAVVLLGFDTVRSAVLSISAFETFRGDPHHPQGNFQREEFWKHSVAVACCAELLAEMIETPAGVEPISPSDAFVCGLLHDLGKVALDTVLPKSYSRVVEAADLLRRDIADLERSIIGLDHMVVGKRLAERWNLPVNIRESIWLHGQHPSALPGTVRNPRLINLITLCDVLVRQQYLGYSGNYVFPISRQALIDAAGLTAEAIEPALRHLVERVETRAVALDLGKVSTSELYQSALARANQELGRVGGQLAAKNRRLSVRAKFFDALSAFHSELHPDAAPQLVLQAIGQTAVGVLGINSAAVFSLMPGQAFADVMLFDEHGEKFETTLVDCPTRPPPRPTGDGPILPAGDDMDWLLSAVSPRLAHDQRFWICLEADGICVGGVAWGAPSGESQRLSPQAQEISAIAIGWGLALRTAQIREESRALSENLAEANRQLQSAQSQILRQKTLTTIGEMAAGAAHEMNNPLAVISGRSQLLSTQLTDPRQQAAARLIAEQSHRLSHIISELMNFAKPTPPQPQLCDVAELVDRALHDAKQRTDPADRKIEVTALEAPQVTVDSQQISAAIAEVLDNAFLATDAKTGQVMIHAAFDPYSSLVVVTVADNGTGMDESTLKRAFDPFYSHKPAGRRRGMGLAKAMRWLESNGGSMRLESQIGQGTRAMILLPVVISSNGAGKKAVK